MSSAGDKSMAKEGGVGLVLSEEEEWREIVKENSCEGEEEAEGRRGEVDDDSGIGCWLSLSSTLNFSVSCLYSATFSAVFCF